MPGGCRHQARPLFKLDRCGPDRQHMARLYSEFKGTVTPDTDRAAISEALAAYNAAKSR